jgi:hypothetical protein
MYVSFSQTLLPFSYNRLSRVYRPGHAFTDPFDCPARRTSLQMSTLHTLPRRWQELVGPAPLPSTQVLFNLLKYRSNDARAALAASVRASPVYAVCNVETRQGSQSPNGKPGHKLQLCDATYEAILLAASYIYNFLPTIEGCRVQTR